MGWQFAIVESAMTWQVYDTREYKVSRLLCQLWYTSVQRPCLHCQKGSKLVLLPEYFGLLPSHIIWPISLAVHVLSVELRDRISGQMCIYCSFCPRYHISGEVWLNSGPINAYSLWIYINIYNNHIVVIRTGFAP